MEFHPRTIRNPTSIAQAGPYSPNSASAALRSCNDRPNGQWSTAAPFSVNDWWENPLDR